MTDIATLWDNTAMRGDLAFDGALLTAEAGLYTAVLHSLFTDRAAKADDLLPWGSADRRGWWGDVLARVDGDQYGSRLWLLSREKQTPETLARAREYAEEALAWLVTDGYASSVSVAAEWTRPGTLGMVISLKLADGQTQAFSLAYPWSN